MIEYFQTVYKYSEIVCQFINFRLDTFVKLYYQIYRYFFKWINCEFVALFITVWRIKIVLRISQDTMNCIVRNVTRMIINYQYEFNHYSTCLIPLVKLANQPLKVPFKFRGSGPPSLSPIIQFRFSVIKTIID